MKSLQVILTLLFTLSLPVCFGFYLPGVAPHDYEAGEAVTLNVNSLTPSSTQQIKSVISYDYYNEKFHFCKPADGIEKQAESIGSIIFGDRIFNSPLKVCTNSGRYHKKLISFVIVKNATRPNVSRNLSN
jgi:transmembrane 9 superfamily protein 2/4